MRKWRKSTSLAQLSLKDGATPKECLLYQLSARRRAAISAMARAWGLEPEALVRDEGGSGDGVGDSDSDSGPGGDAGGIQRLHTLRMAHPAGLGPPLSRDPTSWFRHVLLVTSPQVRTHAGSRVVVERRRRLVITLRGASCPFVRALVCAAGGCRAQDVYCPVLSGTAILSGDGDRVRRGCYLPLPVYTRDHTRRFSHHRRAQYITTWFAGSGRKLTHARSFESGCASR